MEMENCDFEAGALDVVAATMAVDLATAFARMQRKGRSLYGIPTSVHELVLVFIAHRLINWYSFCSFECVWLAWWLSSHGWLVIPFPLLLVTPHWPIVIASLLMDPRVSQSRPYQENLDTLARSTRASSFFCCSSQLVMGQSWNTVFQTDTAEKLQTSWPQKKPLFGCSQTNTHNKLVSTAA